MKTHVVKYLVVCLGLCVVAASCSCFQKHIPPPTANVNTLFEMEPSGSVSSTASSKQCNSCTDGGLHSNLLGVNWGDVSSKIANNWLAIAMCSFLPFIVFWHNMKHRLQDWKKSFILKEKADTYSRRPTLPDLTWAKHARRESLAESTQNHKNRALTMSQYSISKNQELGDTKRVHIIRRRH